jgi:type II secretory pathway pseudopilin PulG
MLKPLLRKHYLDGTSLLDKSKKNIQLLKVNSSHIKETGFSIIELLLATVMALVAVNASAQLINHLNTSGLNSRAAANSAVEVAINNDLAWFRQYAVLWQLKTGPYETETLPKAVTKTDYNQIQFPNTSYLSNEYVPQSGCGTPALANDFQKDAASIKDDFDILKKPPYDIPKDALATTLKLPISATGYKLERKIESNSTVSGSLTISYTLTNSTFNNPLVFKRFSSIYLPAAGWCPP